MYILWAGRGFFVFLVPFVVYMFLGDFPSDKLVTYDFLISGPLIYLLAYYYNGAAEKIQVIRATEGELSTFKKLLRKAHHDVLGDPASRPSFFFIPMAWWGVGIFVLGLAFQFFPATP